MNSNIGENHLQINNFRETWKILNQKRRTVKLWKTTTCETEQITRRLSLNVEYWEFTYFSSLFIYAQWGLYPCSFVELCFFTKDWVCVSNDFSLLSYWDLKLDLEEVLWVPSLGFSGEDPEASDCLAIWTSKMAETGVLLHKKVSY